MASCNDANGTADDVVPYNIVPPPKAKSRCWKYFGFKATPSGEIIDKKRMICRLCRSEFSYSGNTSNLSQHLTRKHPHLQSDIQRTPNTSFIFLDELRDFSTQEVITVRSSAPDIDVNVSIVKYLAKSMLPLRTVEAEPFVDFVKALRPEAIVPDLITMKSCIVPSTYNKVKQELFEALQCVATCSLSAYVWDTPTKKYLTISTRFVDEHCRLRCRVLKTCGLSSGDDAEERLYQQLHDVAIEWSLTKERVIAVVGPNVDDDSVPKAAAMLGLDHIPCIDHVLQLIWKDVCSIDDVSRAMIRLQELVAYIKSDGTVQDDIRSRLLDSNATTWKIPSVGFGVDDECWNSTYEIASRMLVDKEVVWLALAERNAARSAWPTDDEWSTLDRLVAATKPLHIVVTSLCRDDCVCLSLVKPIVSQLINKRCQITDSDCRLVRDIKQRTKRILEDYFANKKFDRILNSAAFLDPRFKVLGFMTAKEKELLVSDVQIEMLKHARVDDVKSAKRVKRECESDISFLLAEVCENDSASSVEERTLQEVAAYRLEEPASFECNPVDWWKMNWHRYPLLFNVAKAYLSVPATCRNTEFLYSKRSVDDVTLNRCRIESKYVDVVMFLHSALND